jgi:8-oxo-dGTP pyrophosphatase MutT (NUDIX family)
MARKLSRFQVAMKALIVRDGKLLLVREAAGKKLWELPGGRIEVGEERLRPAKILRRELDEELGRSFRVHIGPPVAVWTRQPAPPRRNSWVFLVGLACRWRSGSIELSDEHIDFAWVTQRECSRLRLAPGYAWIASGKQHFSAE